MAGSQCLLCRERIVAVLRMTVNFSKKHLDFSLVMCENKASGYDRLMRGCYEIIYT